MMLQIQNEDKDKDKLPIKKTQIKRKTKKNLEHNLRVLRRKGGHKKKQSEYHSNFQQMIKSKAKRAKHKSFRKGSDTMNIQEKEDIDKQHVVPNEQERDLPDVSGTDLTPNRKDILANVQKGDTGKKIAKETRKKTGKRTTKDRGSGKKKSESRKERGVSQAKIKVTRTSISPKKKKARTNQSIEKLKQSEPDLPRKSKLKRKDNRRSVRKLKSSKTEKAIISKKSFRKKTEPQAKVPAKKNQPKPKPVRIRKSKKTSISNLKIVRSSKKIKTKTRERLSNLEKKFSTTKP